MATIHDSNVVIQPVRKVWHKGKVATLDMLRLDLLHPVVSGNKWYKLRLNLNYALDNQFTTIATFGGAYSNHLVAAAYAAQHFGLQSVGIVRGIQNELTPTLLHCQQYGMKLLFVSREEYTLKNDPEWVNDLLLPYGNTYIIPEGGANARGVLGAGLINRFIGSQYTHIALSVGTGTTLAGLRNALLAHQSVMGFVPMKQCAEQQAHIIPFLRPDRNTNWQLFPETHFGGFGKIKDELIVFMNDFYADNHIPLDVVYTSKMMYNIQQLLNDNYFNSSDKLLCIHTGGIQGNVSVQDKLIF